MVSQSVFRILKWKFHLEYFTLYFINFAAFQCILEGQRVVIPTEIPASYVKKAEEIVSKSYDHSETFSSVCVFVLKNMYRLCAYYIH